MLLFAGLKDAFWRFVLLNIQFMRSRGAPKTFIFHPFEKSRLNSNETLLLSGLYYSALSEDEVKMGPTYSWLY